MNPIDEQARHHVHRDRVRLGFRDPVGDLVRADIVDQRGPGAPPRPTMP